MGRQRRLTFEGLNVAPGHYARGDGALIEATNLVVDAPGVIRSRQGFARQANSLGGPIWKLASTKELGSNLLINYGTDVVANALRYGDGSSAPTLITGAVTNDPDARMQVAVSRANHYLTSTEGLRRLESDYALFHAGMPPGLQLDQTGPAAVLSAGSVVSNNSSVAYRVTFFRNDATGLEMQGPPSARTVVTNAAPTTGAPGATANVLCRVLLPQSANTTTGTPLTTAYGFRLWRSAEATGGAPPDDMRLVYEAKLAAGDITAGYVDVTDSTPEAFRAISPPLYTNANDFGEDGIGGPGIQQANNIPPRCMDVELFAGCIWGADLTYQAQLEITLLSTVAATGLTAGDTLTISGVTYTAIAPGAPAAGQFVVVTAGTVSDNIQRTAQNLVEAINKYASNTLIYAYYVSGPLNVDLPGRILLVNRSNATGSFTAVASAHGTAYRPQLASAVTSTTTVLHNAVAFAKQDQPDAWPYVNVFTVGQRSTFALRIRALGHSLLIFGDVGVYRVTGDNFSNFNLSQVDPTFRLLGRECIATCDGAVYALGLEGLARVTETGLEYVSRPIEPLFWQALNDAGVSWLGSRSWMTAYRSRHKVLMALPSDSTASNAGLIYCYDTRTGAWTRWDFPREAVSLIYGRSAGVVRFNDDLIFMGNWNATGVDAYLFKERRDYASTDYQDTDTTGTTGAITRSLTWNVETEGPESEQSFDEVHLLWEVSDVFTALTTPSSATLTVTGNYGTAQTFTFAPEAGKPSSRQPVPQDARRGGRVKVRVRNAVQSEAFGLEGQVLLVQTDKSTRTTRQ